MYPEYVKVGNKKYKINTSYKTAIKCNAIAEDDNINDIERALAIIYKLFGEEALEDVENRETLLEKAKKYLSCGVENVETSNEPKDMDFIEDMPYIKASFMSDYHIDLNKTDMHWWEFYELINGLSNSEMGNCCVLNRIRNLRTFNLGEIKDPREREKIRKAKKAVELKKNKKKASKTQEQSAREFYTEFLRKE